MSKRPSSSKQNGLSCKKKKNTHKKTTQLWVRWFFEKNVSYCYHLFRILVWSVSDKKSYFWTRERDLKQLSRGLHGIKRALKKRRKKKKKKQTQRIPRQNEGKNQKMKCSSFCIQDNLFCCCCFLVCCCCFLFVFVFFFDGPPGLAGLVTHDYLASGCENTQTRTAALTSVASEAKYTKSVSTFFRLQPKPVLDKCQGEKRHIGAIVFAEQ